MNGALSGSGITQGEQGEKGRSSELRAASCELRASPSGEFEALDGQQKRLNETKQSNNGLALFSNLSALSEWYGMGSASRFVQAFLDQK